MKRLQTKHDVIIIARTNIIKINSPAQPPTTTTCVLAAAGAVVPAELRNAEGSAMEAAARPQREMLLGSILCHVPRGDAHHVEFRYFIGVELVVVRPPNTHILPVTTVPAC